MTDPSDVANRTADTIHLSRAAERIRQEQETFDQLKSQDQWWFRLRMGLGIVAGVLIPAIFVASLAIIWNESLPDSLRMSGGVAIVVDVLAIATLTWKIVLPPGSADRLTPVTVVDASPNDAGEQPPDTTDG